MQAQIDAASAQADAARRASEKAEAHALRARRGCESMKYEAELSKRRAEVARAEATAKAVESEVVRAEIRVARAQRAVESAKDKMDAAQRAAERADNAVDLAKRAQFAASSMQMHDSDSIEFSENQRINKVETDSLIRAADAARAECVASSNEAKIEQAELNAAKAELDAAKAKLCFAESVAKFGQLHLEAAKKSNLAVVPLPDAQNQLKPNENSQSSDVSHRSSSDAAGSPALGVPSKNIVFRDNKVQANGKIEIKPVELKKTQDVRGNAAAPSRSVRVDAVPDSKKPAPKVPVAPNNRVEAQKPPKHSAEPSMANGSKVVVAQTKSATTTVVATPVGNTNGLTNVPNVPIPRNTDAANTAKNHVAIKKPVRRPYAIPIVHPDDVAKEAPKKTPEKATDVASASKPSKPNVNETPSIPSNVAEHSASRSCPTSSKGSKKTSKPNQPARIRYCAQCNVREQPKVPKKGFYRGPTGNRTLCLDCNLKWLMQRKAENVAKEEAEKAKKPTAGLNVAAAAFTPGMPIQAKQNAAASAFTTPVTPVQAQKNGSPAPIPAAPVKSTPVNVTMAKDNDVKNEKKAGPVIPKTVLLSTSAPVKHSRQDYRQRQDHRQKLPPKVNPPNSVIHEVGHSAPSTNVNGGASMHIRNNPFGSGKPVVNRGRVGNRVGASFDARPPPHNNPPTVSNIGANPFEAQGMSNGGRGVVAAPQLSKPGNMGMPLDPMAANRRRGPGSNSSGGNSGGGGGYNQGKYGNAGSPFDPYPQHSGYDSRRNPIGTGFPPRNQDPFAKQRHESNTYYDEGYVSSNGEYRSNSGYSESNWDNSGGRY